MATLMWEVRAAPGLIDELVAFVIAAADPSALVFRSSAADDRVVVIDPTCSGIRDVPAELISRAPQAWSFDEVQR